MPYDLSKLLVIGVSSRALFDLRIEDTIHKQHGLRAFIQYQIEHEADLLNPGTGFPLVHALLQLNQEERRVEVIVMSKNHPECSLRVFNSIRHHGLDISRAALVGGASLAPYLPAYSVHLFLTADRADVRSALESGVPAALIYDCPADPCAPAGKIRIAFDGDSVLFSGESELINERQGLLAFHEFEKLHADSVLEDGPLTNFLRKLAQFQTNDPQDSPVRIALITARNSPAHERVIRTFRAWGVRIDEAHFLGGITKRDVVRAFQPHIFFDDQAEHCESASQYVPTAQVLARDSDNGGHDAAPASPGHKKFDHICRIYLRKDYDAASVTLASWYSENLQAGDDGWGEKVLLEFEESAKSIPIGAERRAVGEENTRLNKLLGFLDKLVRKHRPK
jgi:5'-nucleotidase